MTNKFPSQNSSAIFKANQVFLQLDNPNYFKKWLFVLEYLFFPLELTQTYLFDKLSPTDLLGCSQVFSPES